MPLMLSTPAATAVTKSLMGIVFLVMSSVNNPSTEAVVLKSPAQDASVVITNDRVQDWWDHYEKGDGYRNAKKKELSKPEPVILRWEMTQNTDCDYSVWVSEDSQFKNAKVFRCKKNSCEVYNLLRDRTYYWRVGAVGDQLLRVSPTNTFRTKNTARIIRVKGAYNTRDLGGYKTSSGKTVKQGMVYRSGNFDDIKKAGEDTIKGLGIKTQLDLRKEGEGESDIKMLPVKNYFHRRAHSYLRFTISKRRKRRMVKIMKTFADENNYPIIFHCTYGRDRAGTIAFFLNGLLGVGKKDLYRDYELTYLSKYSGSSGEERLQQFDQLYDWVMNYKDPSQSLQYNLKSFLTDYGMTEAEVSNIERIMLE